MTLVYYCKAPSQIHHEVGYRLLAKHLGYQPALIYNSYGKPYLNDQSCYFNLSHQENWVVLAVSDHEVGIDVQAIRSLDTRVVQRMFHPLEQKKIQTIEDGIKLWCMKESYGKYKGSGIQIQFRILDFSKGLQKDCFAYEDFYLIVRKIENSVVAICSNDDKINMIPVKLEDLIEE